MASEVATRVERCRQARPPAEDLLADAGDGIHWCR